jgi:DNA-binding transcriptional LysR family regulator
MLLEHLFIRTRFANGRMPAWELEKNGELIRVDPPARLIVSTAAADLAVSAAIAGVGVVFLFEEWLQPVLKSGALSRC